MRSFIAIELDPTIKDAILAFIQKLDASAPNIRWVQPQGMHLTLKFLGEVAENKITEIRSVLDKIAKEYTRFPLSLKGTGTFPPTAPIPRVVWIGIEENQSLQNIQVRVENELHKIRFPREKRNYHPHLTLGRVKGPQNIETVIGKLSQNKQSDFGEMTVSKITLFKSTLKPTGAEYTIVSEFNLE